MAYYTGISIWHSIAGIVWLRVGLGHSYRLLLNTAKNTRDPFAIDLRHQI